MAQPTCQTIPLDRKKILKKTLEQTWRAGFGAVFLVVFLTIMFFSIFLEEGASSGINIMKIIFFGVSILVVILVVIGIVSYFYQKAYFKSYYYNFEKDVMVIKKGVFTPQETSLPYKKINDVYVDMDLLDRLFGLRDVHVATASDISSWIAHIDGVNPDNAEKLKKLILDKIKKS